MEQGVITMKDEAIVRYQKALCVCGYHMFTRKDGKLQLVKLLCAWWSQRTLMTNTMEVEKDEKVIEHLP